MKSPLLLGHRGARASRQIPENTLASFELCLSHGCDGFEFDVRCSYDARGVICHDPHFGDLSIAKTAAENLKLPTLDDVLRRFAERAFLDIELKVAGLEELTLTAVRQHAPRKGYVVSSFLPDVLHSIRALDGAIPLGFLCETRRELRVWRDMPGEWVIPRVDLTDRELVDDVYAAGKKIMVWTVNRAERMLELAEWGVDAIISDETELLNRTLS